MHLSESWTLFAAMNEFDDCTGREMDHFNRYFNEKLHGLSHMTQVDQRFIDVCFLMK